MVKIGVVLASMNINEIIAKHGGVSALARRLTKIYGYEFTRQRVSIWKVRGIPARILLDNPRLFRGYAE